MVESDKDIEELVRFCEELSSYKYVQKALDRSDERHFYFCRVTSPETDLLWDAPGMGFFVPKFEIFERFPRGRKTKHDLLPDVTQERYGLFIGFQRYFYRNVGRGISSEYIKERINGIYAATPKEVAELINRKHEGNLDVRGLRERIKNYLRGL